MQERCGIGCSFGSKKNITRSNAFKNIRNLHSWCSILTFLQDIGFGLNWIDDISVLLYGWNNMSKLIMTKEALGFLNINHFSVSMTKQRRCVQIGANLHAMYSWIGQQPAFASRLQMIGSEMNWRRNPNFSYWTITRDSSWFSIVQKYMLFCSRKFCISRSLYRAWSHGSSWYFANWNICARWMCRVEWRW